MYSGEVSTLWKLVVKLSVTKHFTKVYKVRINNTKELVCLLSGIYGDMDALEKFGEHERSVRVALFLMNHFSTSPILRLFS